MSFTHKGAMMSTTHHRATSQQNYYGNYSLRRTQHTLLRPMTHVSSRSGTYVFHSRHQDLLPTPLRSKSRSKWPVMTDKATKAPPKPSNAPKAPYANPRDRKPGKSCPASYVSVAWFLRRRFKLTTNTTSVTTNKTSQQRGTARGNFAYLHPKGSFTQNGCLQKRP